MANFEEQVEKKIEEIKAHTFLDPTLDANFKRIFSKDSTLIHFLNAILRLKGENRIRAIQRRKPSVALTSKIGREEVRFDIHAQLENCKYVDLE